MSTTTCLHSTGKYHIDALAVGPEFTALATSSLTGDVWDGHLALVAVAADGGSASVARAEATQNGNGGLAWVSSDALAVGDDAGDISVWSVDAGKAGDAPALRRLAGFGEHTQPVTALAASTPAPARVASTSLDGTARVWDASVAGGALAKLEHLARSTWCEVAALSVAWMGSAPAHTLATGASDGVVRLWDVRAPQAAALRFAPHSASLLALSAGAAAGQLLAGSECGALLLLDERRSDAPVASAQLHPSAPLCALSAVAAADGGAPLVAAGAEDGSVVAVDPRDLHVAATCAAHAGRVGGLAWLTQPTAAGAGALLSGGWDKRLVHVALPARGAGSE
jgi:WD40 repeat protein